MSAVKKSQVEVSHSLHMNVEIYKILKIFFQNITFKNVLTMGGSLEPVTERGNKNDNYRLGMYRHWLQFGGVLQMKAVTFKYDTIFKKSMSFTMQISDELYDALKIQDKMQDFRVSEIMDDISSMLSIAAELQGFGAIKGGYSIDFNDN